MDSKQLAKYFRDNMEEFRKKWIDIMLAKGLLKGINPEDIEAESRTIYDACVTCLETGEYTKAEEYAHTRAARGVVQGLTITDFLSGMLILRDAYSRVLVERFRKEGALEEALSIYGPVADQILLICALAFTREREMLVKKPLEASVGILDEWIFALVAFAQSGEGLSTFRRIEREAARHWFNATLKIQFPRAKTAYDACLQYRDLVDEAGMLEKEHLQLEQKGQTVTGTFIQPCPYVRACTWAQEIGLKLSCLRATPFVMAIELMTGKAYRSELMKFDREKACIVSAIPTEWEFKVILSSKLSLGSVKVSVADLGHMGIDLVDNVTISPTQEGARKKRLKLMSFSQSTLPPRLVLMSIADAQKLGLNQEDSVYLRRSTVA